MTIWLLHQTLTTEEEAHIQERSHLALPFEGLPDLSLITSPVECKHLLAALHPQDPPESINRRFDALWPRYAGLHGEDIIAVPLHARKAVALAEVTGPYHYEVGKDGADRHLIPVKWHPGPVPLYKFRKHKDIFARRERMFEVTNAEARIAIRDRLPHRYNRFVKWKWILLFFFALGMLHRLQSLLKMH